MKKTTVILTFAALAFFVATAGAQTRRRATLVSADNPSEGRCTVSVRLDGPADIEIRGDNAMMSDTGNGYASWQRFECTGPLPDAGANLQLRAIEGEGRMVLTQDSSRSGVAIIHVANPDFRDTVYTFDVFWRWPERVYTSSDADRMVMEDDSIRACQNAVEDRIRSTGFRSVRFFDTSKDARGATDRVVGSASARRDGEAAFTFACRVDPLNGHVSRVDLSRR